MLQNHALKEINALLARRVLAIVEMANADGLKISVPQFIETIENERDPQAYENLRLVVQKFQ